MAVINFSIPKNLDDRIKTVIREKGFASKAEFFRYCVVQYMDSDKIRNTHLAG